MTSDDLAARGAPERIWAYTYDDCDYENADEFRLDIQIWQTADPYPIEAQPYILATPAALAASPEVAALIREAEARGMERAAQICTDAEDSIFGKSMDLRTAAITIRAEAAAIRGEGK